MPLDDPSGSEPSAKPDAKADQGDEQPPNDNTFLNGAAQPARSEERSSGRR